MPQTMSVKTTTFVEDSNVNQTNFKTTLRPNDTEVANQTIPDFLSKPHLISSGLWTTSNTQNTTIYSTSVSTELLANTAWSDKLSGFAMYRGTAVFTLMINANPFQQGKLLMSFLPCLTQFSVADSSFVPSHRTLISSKRMTPCVELDCRETTAIMKLPYVAPTNYYCATGYADEVYDWGSVFIDVLMPMKTGASGDVDLDYSLYLHFEDFELAAPTVPQAGKPSKRYSAKASKEKDALGGGTVSKGLALASTVASSLSIIPSLMPVAQPLSWSLRGLSGVASFFGWSKAQLQEIPMSVARQFQRYAATSDGTDTSYPLALLSDNMLAITDDHSLTNEDEMSLKYLLSIPTLISTDTRTSTIITWTDAITSGTNLVTNLLVGPTNLYVQSTKVVLGHTATYRVGPPVYYLSELFRHYRGGIKLTFKIAKTEFHSGRLQVCFTPYSASYTAPTVYTSTLALREIIDIRCGSEFDIIIPYIKPSNYAVVGEYLGHVDVKVLNELRMPETASTNVDILVYASAAEDFEFQSPINYGNRNLPFSPQMDCKQLVDEPIGNSKKYYQTMKYAEESIGEFCASIKQLLSRNSPVAVTAFNSGNSGATMSFWPFATSMTSLASATGNLQSPIVGGDILSYISPMYAFYKGGMRVVVTTSAVTQITASLINFSANIALILDTGNYATMPIVASNYLSGSYYSAWNGTVQGDSNVANFNANIPYYSPCAVSINTAASPTTNYARTDKSQPAAGINLVGSSGAFTACGITRSVRDDFVYSYFIGCPPRLISYA